MAPKTGRDGLMRCYRKIIFCLLVLFASFCFASGSVIGNNITQENIANDKIPLNEQIAEDDGDDERIDVVRTPLSVTAKSIVVDNISFFAEGGVVATYRDMVISSDTLEGEKGSHVVKALGNVILEQAGEKTYGKELVYNTKERKGRMTDPNGQTKNIYIAGRPIQGTLFYKGDLIKWETDFFELFQAAVTTCDFPEEKKHYRLIGKKVEVYPGDVMIIHNASLYIGKHKIWTIPKYVVNLRPERRKKQSHPEIGYNKTDGFFINTRTPYYFNRGSYGDFMLNWAQKQGFTEGVDHYYTLGSKGDGQLHIFKQNSQAAGIVRERFSTLNSYRFGDGINATMGFSLYQDRVAPFNAPTIMSAGVSVSKQSKFYRSSLGLGVNTFGPENQSFSLNFQHNVAFRHDLRGDFQATYFANSSPYALTTSLLTKTGFVHTGKDLTTELVFEKSQTNPQAIFVERIPEVTFRTPVRKAPWLDIPYQMQLGVGRFLETNTLRTVDRADFLFTLPYKSWEVTPHTWLNSYFQYKQDMYLTNDIPSRDIHARYILSSNLLLRELLFNHIEFQTGFRMQTMNGYNPLQFDNLNRYKLVTGELSVFNRDYWRLNVGTAYDLDNEFYQNLIGRLDFRPKKDWRLHMDGTYDINRRTMQNIVGYSDVLLMKDLRFQHWMSYDFGQKKITYQDYALIKDYHDWSLSLVYRGSRQEMFLHATLKAFPDEGVGIGLSPEGPILDPALQQFFR